MSGDILTHAVFTASVNDYVATELASGGVVIRSRQKPSDLVVSDGATSQALSTWAAAITTATAPVSGSTGAIMQVAERTFTETAGAGVYTATVAIPAGATIHDIVVNGVSLWTASTSATMTVGDAGNASGYFAAVNLKATDLLAGESISFDQAGGKAGAYIANSQVSPRYSASARTISGVVTTVGTGTGGVTRMTVVWSAPSAGFIVAATKV
jgi:hypothetical protein